MSNHSGGHMLAAMLNEFNDIGLLEMATQEQRARIANVLWRLGWTYDCNWGEILDTKMALLLNACIDCGKTGSALDSNGRCLSCSEMY